MPQNALDALMKLVHNSASSLHLGEAQQAGDEGSK